jgi:hypothetical protein
MTSLPQYDGSGDFTPRLELGRDRNPDKLAPDEIHCCQNMPNNGGTTSIDRTHDTL